MSDEGQKQGATPRSKNQLRKRKEGLYAVMTRQVHPLEYGEFQKQVEAEQNPRGAALLIACNLELALDITVQHLFDRHRLTHVYGPNKALGSFSNKISMAYALGIFGDETLMNLDLIKAVRNVFAHCQAPVTFETPEIAEAVAYMQPPKLLPPYTVGSENIDWNARVGRQRYAATCDNTAHNLLYGARTRRYGSLPIVVERLPAKQRVELLFEPLP